MANLMRCTRCGSWNDHGVCWRYDGNDDAPVPSGLEHDMRATIQEGPVMTLQEILELSAEDARDLMWED